MEQSPFPYNAAVDAESTILGMYIAHVHKVVGATLIKPHVSSLESSERVLGVHISGVNENMI